MTLRNMEWLRVALGLLFAAVGAVVLVLSFAGPLPRTVGVLIALASVVVAGAFEPWDWPRSRSLPTKTAA